MTMIEQQRMIDAEPRGGWHWLRLAGRICLVLIVLPFFLALIYGIMAPPISTLMVWRAVQGQPIHKTWKPLDQISQHLATAVVTSEDARFCSHNGVDWEQVEQVLEDAGGSGKRRLRGASTIPMQTAKNLFLWPSRSIVRKALEVPLAYWIDLIWSKRRLLEIYLNVVEWGPGIYGAEAAAQHYFRTPAAKLTRGQASLLAASLPNPLVRSAGKPSRLTRRIAQRLRRRMRGMGGHLKCLDDTPG